MHLHRNAMADFAKVKTVIQNCRDPGLAVRRTDNASTFLRILCSRHCNYFTLQVSWSMLSPYRLVTFGVDGLVRTWDVREACLKRYGHMIGNRSEYSNRVIGEDVSSGVVFGSVDGGEDAESPAVQGNAASISLYRTGTCLRKQ